MNHFVKLDERNALQLQDVRAAAYHIARREIADREYEDPTGELATELADYLFQEAERWASFDEEMIDTTTHELSYEAVIEEFYV